MTQAKDEIFDVVDGSDAVVGQASRREVHARHWFHRAVHVLVFGASGQVFLQKRSLKKDMAPGCWDSSCSGHVDAGEDYDAAAVRELGEEIGLKLDASPQRWFRIEARAETGWEFVWVYRLNHPGPFVLNEDEIERGDWFSPAEVARLISEKPDEVAISFRYLWAIASSLAAV